MRTLYWLLITFVSAVAAGGPANASDRIGLVIANSAYAESVGSLKNAGKSAELVTDALRRTQFRTPVLARDLDLTGMRAELGRHAARVKAAGKGAIGIIYYAGHGAANPDRQNYLVPVGVSARQLHDLDTVALSLREIIATLRAAAPEAEHILVLDACRNEMAAPQDASAAATPGGRGFTMPTEADVAPGFMVVFSTDAGRTAADSPVFAAHLADGLVRANTAIPVAMELVKARTAEATGDRQVPWHLSQLRRSLSLGAEVAGDGARDARFEATDKRNLLFLERNVEVYRRADAASGIVEIRALGATLATTRPDDIFLVVAQNAGRWITYQSRWGRVYVQADKVQLF